MTGQEKSQRQYLLRHVGGISELAVLPKGCQESAPGARHRVDRRLVDVVSPWAPAECDDQAGDTQPVEDRVLLDKGREVIHELLSHPPTCASKCSARFVRFAALAGGPR